MPDAPEDRGAAARRVARETCKYSVPHGFVGRRGPSHVHRPHNCPQCAAIAAALLAFPGGDAEPVDPSKLDRVRAEKIMPACEWTPPCDETESRSPCFRCRTVDAIADALALAHSEAAAPVAGEAGAVRALVAGATLLLAHARDEWAVDMDAFQGVTDTEKALAALAPADSSSPKVEHGDA